VTAAGAGRTARQADVEKRDKGMEDKYGPLKLENQVCFPLYAAAREMIRRYKPSLDALDLTYTQYIAMMVLWEQEEISVRDLGKKLFLDSGTLTPVLKSMENKGFLIRRRCMQDERMVMVELTPKGRALREKTLIVPQEMKKHVHLTPEEVLQLYRLLYKLLGVPSPY